MIDVNRALRFTLLGLAVLVAETGCNQVSLGRKGFFWRKRVAAR